MERTETVPVGAVVFVALPPHETKPMATAAPISARVSRVMIVFMVSSPSIQAGLRESLGLYQRGENLLGAPLAKTPDEIKACRYGCR